MGEPPRSIQTDFSELLRRRRGSGRRLLLLLYLLVMVLVLRGALVRLSGLGLRRSCRSRRSGGALRLSGRRRLCRRRGGGLRGEDAGREDGGEAEAESHGEKREEPFGGRGRGGR